jgi:DUF971 family protein
MKPIKQRQTRLIPVPEQQQSSTPVPVHLEKTDDRKLLIRWSDEFEQAIAYRKLRDNCQCAKCIDERMEALKEQPGGEAKLSNTLPVLSIAETMPLDIVLMHPVGNYAYNIHFSDGHSSGIFTFEMLRALS